MTRRAIALFVVLALGMVPAPAPASADEGTGSQPVSKQCVGDPPRQTEDPNSPPCVPFFHGDNGGATYPGVTADEIRVLLYVDNGFYAGELAPSPGTYVDVDAPPKPPCAATYPAPNPDRDACDHVLVRIARAYSRFFNERYQTYDRHLHYYLYVSDAQSPSERAEDATRNVDDLEPFAVLDQAVFSGHNESYLESMSARDVMVFATQGELSADLLEEDAPLLWTFPGHVERKAELYTTYVCDKVEPHPVSHTDDLLIAKGAPRVLGLYSTTDPARPDLRRFADLVKAGLSSCGVSWQAEATYPHEGAVIDGRDDRDSGVDAVLRFRKKGVTTVLWLGGVETTFPRAAGTLLYRPEIVLAGIGGIDGRAVGRFQNQDVWKNAWAVHYPLRKDRAEETFGYRALKEGDPNLGHEDAARGAESYRDHFMLAQAVQVSGPNLHPDSVEEGFFALPAATSTSPYHASCAFAPGDRTCVDDATEVWWDPSGRIDGTEAPGCMRMVREGERYLTGAWAGGDDVFANPADPCTTHGRTFVIRF